MITAMIVAGAGGFLGSCGRYLTGVVAKKLWGSSFPWGTFIVNVVGCFLIGLFFGLWGRHDMDPMVKVLLITGFCGGFTTFSSFSHDGYSLIVSRQWSKFIAYLVGSVVLGLSMVYVGMACI